LLNVAYYPEQSKRTIVDIERKQATCLFADIVDSTRLIAGLDPEQAMERLRPAVAVMCETVEKFQGTVVRTLGDGIMVLFGAPKTREGHAFLACAAAIALQKAFPNSEEALAIRVGLHSGEVVSDPTREQGAHGMTVHLASRMQQIAEPRQICLTGDCYRLIRPYCDVRPLGPMRPKGVPEAVDVYCLLGLRPAVASQQFQINLTSFRGREAELTLLQKALGDARQGNGNVVGIVAPPGTGKSRLCYEFAEACRAQHVPVLEARASIFGSATPLQPVLELLRLFFRISVKENPEIARRRIARRVVSIDPGFTADLPLVFDFLGISDPKTPSEPLDPKARQSRLLQLVRRIVQKVGQAASVVIIEDLHWLDEASEEFVTVLVDAVVGTHTMLLFNFRPTYTSLWMNQPHFTALELGDLTANDIDGVIQELTGAHPGLSELRGEIAKRCAGNPFFAEELVRSLVDSGALLGSYGDYRPSPDALNAPLPPTVQAVLGARIDRLSEVEKQILQVGAVIGKEFHRHLLESVARLPLVEIDAVLGRLCELKLIQKQFGPDVSQFAFRHPLVQEVAYAMLLKSRRRALHHELAIAMEGFYRNHVDEFAGLIAHHYEAADQCLQASNHWARAAMWVGKTNSAQGLQHWKKVRSLLHNAPTSNAGDMLHALSCGQIMNFGWREGMTPDEARPYAEEARRLVRDGGDTNLLTHILAAFGRICGATGSADEYVSSISEGLSLVSPRTQPGRYATLNAKLSQAYTFAGLLNEALAANTIALEGSPHIEPADYQILGFNLDHWIKCLRTVYLFSRVLAEPRLQKTLEMEPGKIDPVVHYIPHAAYVDLAWSRRDASLAWKHATHVSEIAELSAIPYLRVYALACTGLAKSIAGEYENAARDLSEALDFARRSKVGLEYEARMLADLAECHWCRGDLAQALATAREAIDIARWRAARCAECHASIISASILVNAKHAGDEADSLFKRAEEIIEQSGARIFEPLLTRGRSASTRPNPGGLATH
jgi:adenylate cyclase